MSVYINIWDYIDDNVFYIFGGGRGCGKTDSALRGCLGINNNRSLDKFMLLRRTETELNNVVNNFVNPFSAINARYGTNISVNTRDKILSFKQDNTTIGYAAALTTVRNIRGLSLEDVDTIIFDEFIPEPHAKPIKGEAMALFNAYETINRNRELAGKQACRLILLCNMFNNYSPILSELGLVNVVFDMLKCAETKTVVYEERKLKVVIFDEREFVAAKQETALGKLTRGTQYESIAITQNIVDNTICRQPLNQYRKIVSLGGFTIWEHKSDDVLTYITECAYTDDSKETIDRYLRFIKIPYERNKLLFATAEAKSRVHKLYPSIINML